MWTISCLKITSLQQVSHSLMGSSRLSACRGEVQIQLGLSNVYPASNTTYNQLKTLEIFLQALWIELLWVIVGLIWGVKVRPLLISYVLCQYVTYIFCGSDFNRALEGWDVIPCGGKAKSMKEERHGGILLSSTRWQFPKVWIIFLGPSIWGVLTHLLWRKNHARAC